ncbi:hypothetical protein Patl1_26551 [Pistacia atlantica]|uniref:Uncharacterized protein n=1 Tax=Pistacia atlantica TaxID=434234 RepID=A0ACC1AZS7_9ROSI|nr:hypothetical protein Patl1_26551 [Pistacia atlantica]
MGNNGSKGCFNMGDRNSKCNCSMNNEAFKSQNNINNNYFKGLIGRSAAPSHYLVKMDSFSFLSKASTHEILLMGYLIDDSCVFGAEVFVVEKTFKGDHLSLMKNYDTVYHTWKIEKFSTLLEEYYESESFGFYKWNVGLYPNGFGAGKGNSISLILGMSGSNVPQDTKLLATCTLGIKDQLYGKHIKQTGLSIHKPSKKICYNIMALEKLKNPKHGFLVDDTLIIEAEVKLVGFVTKWST